MKSTTEDIYQFILKMFCGALLLIFITVSLFAFEKLSKADKDLIIIMFMMQQQQ